MHWLDNKDYYVATFLNVMNINHPIASRYSLCLPTAVVRSWKHVPWIMHLPHLRAVTFPHRRTPSVPANRLAILFTQNAWSDPSLYAGSVSPEGAGG